MTEQVGSLRLRLFIGALGVGLLTSVLLAIALLLQVRDALYARRMSDARETLLAAIHLADARCGSDERCVEEILVAVEHFTLSDGPCAAPSIRNGPSTNLCEELPGHRRSLHLDVRLDPVRAQLTQLDERMLLALALALGVSTLLSLFVLERGVVRRLRAVDVALGVLDARAEDRPFLPEGGDALGRLGGAVNRLAERLAEERARTQAQIVSLQDANRALAEEKQALREARADLMRSERLASAGRLAAGVAHEVGNPLSAVIAYVSLLRDLLGRLAESPEVLKARDYSSRIERESSRVDRILRDLLDLARPREVKLEALDLHHAVGMARALAAPQPLFEHCTISHYLDADLPRALGEDHYLVQVLVNLLSNSAKAGAKNIHLQAHADDRSVVLEVLDDGRGIPPELLPRLFEPFVTSAAPGQGTGLGLALSHATMERIGGSITARANEPTGAIFSLVFRRAPTPVA